MERMLPLPPGDPTEKEVRAALSKLVVHGVDAVWLPEAQALLRLPAVRRKVVELGEEHAADALKAVLKAAVEQLGESQYRPLLTIVLGLDAAYERLPAGEKRAVAGREFRGGTSKVSAGTIRQHHEPRALDQLASLLVSPLAALQLSGEASGSHTSEITWHPELHRQWGREQLILWRFSFLTYRREEVLDALSRLMKESGIHSWSVHEIYGLFDVIVMTWVSAEGMREMTRSLKTLPSLELFEMFNVEQILMDSTWSSELDVLDAIPEEVSPLSGEIRRLSEEGDDLDLSHYEARGLIRRRVVPTIGIGFFVVVSFQGHTLVIPQARQAFETRIAEVVRTARSFSGLAVYAGSGFGTFVIKGTLSSSDLSDLNSYLIEPLLSVAPFQGMRVTTFIASSPAPVFSVERMPGSKEASERRSAEDLLQQEEGLHFEVKDSAFVNLSRWLAEDDPPPPRRSPRATDSLMAAITAFLNAEGGVLLIGAVEEERFVKKRDHPFISSASRIGRYLVTGIDNELLHGIDEFQRRLLDLCRAMIQPEATPFVKLRFDRVGDRTICIVHVRAPEGEISRPWFYCGGRDDELRFVVREGPQSTILTGPAADRYKIAHAAG